MRADFIATVLLVALVRSPVIRPHGAGGHVVPAVYGQGFCFPYGRGPGIRSSCGRFFNGESKISSYWTPSQSEIDRMEAKAAAYVNGRTAKFNENLSDDIDQYCRKYVGLVEADSNRQLLVTVFGSKQYMADICNSSDEAWMGQGGGCTIFYTVYDLRTDKFLSFNCGA